MDEREELLIWTEVAERLRETASLMLRLPETPEHEDLMAEMEGCSMGWTRETPGAPPFLFDRVFAHLLDAEQRERDTGRPGRN